MRSLEGKIHRRDQVLAIFLPVLVAFEPKEDDGVPWLYPWAHNADLHGFKAFYLAPEAFVLRTVIYFAVWTMLAIWTRASWAEPRRMVAAASAGLIVYALTASLAGVDWLESLTPEFHSSIYGLLFVTFQMLTGLAFALVIALWPPDASTFRYGPILLSVLLLWAYIHAMQYIVIWTGNIPDEVAWYLARESGVWGVLLWTLIILQFLVPFFAMLLERVRNGREPLLIIALLTLAMRLLEAVVLAAPGTDVGGTVLLLAVPAATASVGVLWWLGFRIVLERLRSNGRDTAPLPDAFDAAGTPISRPRG
jgi:hypothetical protein